jgi:pyruvate/2-oxoglutarate/acetoin dehydrogenase E1 component
MKYKEEMIKAMNLLRDNGYLFVGQSVKFYGTAMFNTLQDVPVNQRKEFMVAEDFQMGWSIGQSLAGNKICSLFPRMDFLISACDQLVNHLDKIALLSEGRFKPKVIIRTSVGGVKQMNPGLQHMGDYYLPLSIMCKNIDFYYLNDAEMIYPLYLRALESKRSTMLIELGDLYD